MAKLKSDTIDQAEMISYLDSYSDFSFELRTVNALISKGFSCDHGGSYEDRATRKTREFDIRATRVFDKRFLRLAVECKNLRPNFPLLVSCVPRTREESFHEISFSFDPETGFGGDSGYPMVRAMMVESKNVRLTDESSLYRSGDPVGKSCAQVGKSVSDEIVTGDADVYAKWSQALSSANDLTCLACSDGSERTGDVALSLVFPILVVPDDMLWIALYDAQGNRIKAPERTTRISYFVNLDYFHRDPAGATLTISHLEFVTVSGLLTFIDNLVGDDEKVETHFPFGQVMRELGLARE